MENIESIMKNGVECRECGEITPADLMEDTLMCPECEVESGLDSEMGELHYKDLIGGDYV